MVYRCIIFRRLMSTVPKKSVKENETSLLNKLSKHEEKCALLMKQNKSTMLNKRIANEKITLNSYLEVCVDVGQINRAYNILLKFTTPKPWASIDVHHYNIVIRGWAKLGSVAQILETRMHMIRNNIKPNAETYIYMLLGYAKAPSSQRPDIKKLVKEMENNHLDPRKLFQAAYLGVNDRKLVRNLLKTAYPKFNDNFSSQPTTYNCKLLEGINKLEKVPYDFSGLVDTSKLESWAEHQRMIEWKSSFAIKSVVDSKDSPAVVERYADAWQKFTQIWRKSLSSALDESLANLQTQCAITDKIHLYPYLCSIDKNLLINLMMDEIENNAACASFSQSASSLHVLFGTKVMVRYMKAKAISEGSHHEQQKIYNEYLLEYCTNPELMGQMNSREYFQTKAIATKNYAIYRDRLSPTDNWPHHILAAVGRFIYGIILREVKFDPDVVRNPKKDIKSSKMVHAFYTAFFQIDRTHKIKEEFRSHSSFEAFYQKACAFRLKFDYSFLPSSSPPMPWLSYGFGGYLTNRSDLVRLTGPIVNQSLTNKTREEIQKLYPSLDSINALGFCPWMVNKEILDIVIKLFRSGGDVELTVPLDESKMEDIAPILKDDSSKADKILYNKERKKYDQKRREMYSLWRDCLYRLSIANHFRDRIFWFPHNMDFRGRTYPIPPHFNHLGSDLARSLLLFAKGEPLGEKGLDWLKIHLINLVGKMKSQPLKERLEYANSILDTHVLESADHPIEGSGWWRDNENPWQVLACCKEIAKAIRRPNPSEYVSHFPVHQDGSCNGLQHYAALGRDPGGAMAVNLIPSDRPQDVYSRVVDIVENSRRRDEENGNHIAKSLNGFIQRKVIKQTVMTTVYGVTRYGARHQIARQLNAKGYSDSEIWRAANYLVAKTFESIGQMFNKSRLIQDWFNACAYLIASRCKQPVGWETPLGFPIVQPYTIAALNKSAGRLLSPSISTEMPLHNDVFGSSLNASKQKTAFPPNYIHSLDSSHMMLTSLFCQRQGITFVSVHDCYWTHPSTVDVMNRICREQFVALHSEPLLQQLSEQFVERFAKHIEETAGGEGRSQAQETNGDNDEVISDHSIQPLAKMYKSKRKVAQDKTHATFREVPQTGDLDLSLVLKSTYFFS